MTHEEDAETRRIQADAIRRMRDMAPMALEGLREIARNGKTKKDRDRAERDLEKLGFTVDGDEPIAFRHDPRVDE